MTKYEYRTIGPGDTDYKQLEKRLNKLGSEGWKVVGSGGRYPGYDRALTGWIILMREIAADSDFDKS